MLYPSIPKGKVKGSYIGGGIFALLIGFPILLLFLPNFFDSAFNVWLWDWNNLGLNINLEFLNAIRSYVVYLALPLVLFFINVIVLFVEVSRSSLFLKSASLMFIISFVLQHGLWLLDVSDQTLQTLSYVAMGLVGFGFALLVMGMVFRFLPSESQNENRANSFLMFTAIYFFVFAVIDSFGTTFGLLTDFIGWAFPFFMGVYGIAGGLWMLLTSRRSTLYEQQARRNKSMGFSQNNPAMMRRISTGVPEQNVNQNFTAPQIPNTNVPPAQQKINPLSVKPAEQRTVSVKETASKTAPATTPKLPPKAPVNPSSLPPRLPPKLPTKLPPKLPPKTGK